MDEISVPLSLGKVEERFQGTSERVIIQIQDVHAHFFAQENIAALVDHLNRKYDIRTVALEGGWSETSLPKSWAAPASREKRMLLTALLEEEHITGPAYAAITAKTPITLVGIEKQELYQENLNLFLKHLDIREQVTADLKRYQEKISGEKSRIFNPSLLRFDRALVSFREGAKAEKFLPTLISMAKDQAVELQDLDQVLLFNQIYFTEQSISKEKLEAESARIMTYFKKSQMKFEEILKEGKVPPEKLDFYPHSKRYLEMMKLQDKLNHRDFFKQIDTVIARLKEKLVLTEEEKALDLKSERSRLAQKILLYQATPEDIRAYESQALEVQADMERENLRKALDLALQFYTLARKRDDVFFDQLRSSPKLQGHIALVTGGFHTEGLSELLRDAGISYLVIRPEIGTEPGNEELYFARLRDNIAGTQTLSHIQNRFLTPEFDQRLVEGLEVFSRTNDLEAALEIVISAHPRDSGAERESAVDWDEFSAASADQKLTTAATLVDLAREGKMPLVLVIKTSVLKALLQNNLALTIWEEIIAPERLNTIAILKDIDDYLDQTIGIQARVVRIMESSSIDDVVNRRFKSAQDKKQLVVIDPEYHNEKVLTLPDHPISLLLARLIVEQGIAIPQSGDLMAELEKQLQTFFVQNNLLRQSA